MAKSGAEKNDRKIRADIEILAEFVKIWCDDRHPLEIKSPVSAQGKVGAHLNDRGIRLCGQCRELLVYGASMRVVCPHDPKPACRKCPSPCYRPGYREKIREVMRHSGRALVRRGRLDLLIKHLFH